MQTPDAPVKTPRALVHGKGPHQAPKPCLTCGKTFSVYAYWNQAQKRRTCSEDCNRATREKANVRCKGCHKDVPKADFDVPEGRTRRREFCRPCWAGLQKPRNNPTHKGCCKCGVVKPVADFDRYERKGGGCGTAKPYCRACGARVRVTGKGPHKVPHPCVVCGKEFEAVGYWAHVRHLKTCSRECFKEPRRKLGQTCTRCKRDLVRDAFDVRPRCGTLNHVCRKCVAERDRDRNLLLRSRPSSFQIWRTAKLRAEREGYEFKLTQAQARTLYRGKCCLCGRAPSSIRRAGDGPLAGGNTRTYCRRCSRLLNVFEHLELFLLAHEIAAHNPLVPKEGSHAKPTA